VIKIVKGIGNETKKPLDKIAESEERITKLESWTSSQQSDMEDINKKLMLVFEGTLALLDHAIITQNGNGKCHDAQAAMEKYMRDKLNKLSSYQEEE